MERGRRRSQGVVEGQPTQPRTGEKRARSATDAIGAQQPKMNREQQGLTAGRRSCGKDHCSRNLLIGCGELSH